MALVGLGRAHRAAVRTTIVAFATLLGVIIGTPAQAALITFDELTPTETVQTAVDSAGFRFASGHFHTYGCLCRIWAGIASNGTPHIGYESVRGYPITMAPLEGGLFSLFSLDVSEFYANGTSPRANAELLRITGITGSGLTVSHSLYLDGFIDGLGGGADFEHFTLPSLFQDLQFRSVTFTGLTMDGRDGGVALDNIEYQSVPEPGILVLFGLGLTGFGATLRKRR